MPDLSILIPARNEEFLRQTIEDVLKNMRGDTEVIAVLDGCWAEPQIPDNDKVTLIHHTTAIGQRAATNEAARLSRAKFIMKCDAHCAFDEGFDVKLMEEVEPNWTVIPRMYNLHVFSWVCQDCKKTTYQGPRPEKCVIEKKDGKVVSGCGSKNIQREIVWQPRFSRKTDFARFDTDLHFQYWGSCQDRPESQADIADVMCFVGACFLMHRERYWELEGLDEEHGSWGQMGVEISCKSWLSGGRMVVNKRTWFSHLFRTQPGFSFPYPNHNTERARVYSKDLWRNNKWHKQVHPLVWLLEKFAPVPEWTQEHIDKLAPWKEQKAPAIKTSKGDFSKGIVYYTDNRLDSTIMEIAQHQLKLCCNGHKIVSVSLAPLTFGVNLVLGLERGILSMFKQILAGLAELDTDFAFLCEHDMLYHPSHFTFTPSKKDVYYYNENTYKVDAQTGQALFYYTKQTSGLCADRNLLIDHYRERIKRVEAEGFSRKMGFEPGCHGLPHGVDNFKAERWMSSVPNIDIRHDLNLTPSRWSQDQFRNQSACQGWTLSDSVPGWGVTKGRFQEFLLEVGGRDATK